MGESFGPYKLGNDEEILDFISSANIACGFHAGDPATMRKTVKMALEKKVAIGAHPGFLDLVGFGRREINIVPREAYELVLYQVGALSAFVKAEGGEGIQHVKPHGALYNMAAKSANLAEAIAEAIFKIDPSIILFGLSGSELVKAGDKIGLRTANEVFADRTYQKDGSLTSRREANSLITNYEQAVNQVVRMVKEGKVDTQQGVDISIKAETVCIHGDGDNALDFARYIKAALLDAGIRVVKIGDRFI